MKLALFTTPEDLLSEIDSLEHLLEEGVDFLHVRKDNKDHEYMTKIINHIPKKYRPQVVLHGHRNIAEHYGLGGLHHKTGTVYLEDCQTDFQTKAFHSIEEIKACKKPYEYGFLSPIFNSISKPGYDAKFKEDELKDFLNSKQKPFPIFALGGIEESTIDKARELGFDGVGVLGAIWSQIFLHKKISVLNAIKEKL